MTVHIAVAGRTVPFRLDPAHGRWHSQEELPEGDFPLIAVAGGTRYELYSGGNFAEVEK